MNKPKIICINGAPFSGKDTLGEMLVSQTDGEIDKFALPIEEGIVGLFKGTAHEPAFRRARHDPELKDSEFINSMTTRELMIAFSEKCIKPLLGDGAFGVLAVDRTLMRSNLLFRPVIFTDTGFQAEFDAFSSKMKSYCSECDIWLIRITREGRNFDNDSREHVEPNNYTNRFIEVENNGSLEDLYRESLRIAEAMGRKELQEAVA